MPAEPDPPVPTFDTLGRPAVAPVPHGLVTSFEYDGGGRRIEPKPVGPLPPGDEPLPPGEDPPPDQPHIVG